jgi:HEAT repeat protein
VKLLGGAASDGSLDLESVVGLLQRGLNDADDGVRVESLAVLLKLGDPVAWTEALRRLEGSLEERDVAVRTLREAWPALPADAPDQARARLIQLYERRASEGAPGGELTSVLTALGAVPGRATATYLLQVGAKLGDTPLRGITAHRWCVGQAYNAGPEARAVLRERLAEERDPFRRLDLIGMIWQDSDPDALEVLLGVVSDDTLDRHERLYAAERLLHMGASSRVAPVLKALYWESTDPVLRPGLQCLLWAWYGVTT